ncbi:MAG: amidohydrolase family protein [Candidatus Aureabacteria bacterium]|nr:amidohydrolase family protein [Candidatus Auribacterota bacterium]
MRVTSAILLPFILVGLALFQPGCSSLPRYPRTGSRPADTVIANTEVFTADEKNPRAEAVAIADGRIVYVGDADGAADFVGPDTRVIDARGRFLTPGFVDNHCHVLWIGAILSLMTKDLFACSNLEEVKAVVLKQARDNPTLPFVSGVGWKYDYIPGGLPDKAMLDAVIADRPVMLIALDGQTGWVNSRAVKLMEEKNPSAFRELVPSRDEKTGEYTGIFRHFHRFSPLDYFTPEEIGADARERMLKAMDAGLREAVSSGVTTLNDVQIYREFVPMVLEFRDRGGLKDARVRCSLYIGPHSLQNEERFKQDLAWWKEIGKKE